MSQARQEARDPAPSARANVRATAPLAVAEPPSAAAGAVVFPLARAASPPAAPWEGLVEALIAPDPAAVRCWPLEAGLLALMVPAARRLGELWSEDEIGFCEVTLAMHRLTAQLIALEMREDGTRLAAHGGRVLLAPAPDDQHSFGTAFLGFHLRRAGWEVHVEHGGGAAVLAALARRPFAFAGISVGHDRAVAPAASLVREARAVSRNRGLKVAVGGAMLARRPGLPAELGADLWADDAFELVEKCASLAEGD